jgi:hypothetical protein
VLLCILLYRKWQMLSAERFGFYAFYKSYISR